MLASGRQRDRGRDDDRDVGPLDDLGPAGSTEHLPILLSFTTPAGAVYSEVISFTMISCS